MAMLTHGSDLTLAPMLGPLVKAAGGGGGGSGGGGGPRAGVERVAGLGFRAVQLDATLPGLRPRDLDRSARRDLAALLRRRELIAAGLDLFIPRRHFSDPEHQDRAMAATLAAIELAADLGRVPVSLTLPLPAEGEHDAVTHPLIAAADVAGVVLAVHAEDRLDDLAAWLGRVDQPTFAAGLDPAGVLTRGGDPAAAASRFGSRLAAARLADVEADGDLRCPVGEGGLDVMSYRVALDLAGGGGRNGPVVLDLRGLVDPASAAMTAKQTWVGAGFEMV